MAYEIGVDFLPDKYGTAVFVGDCVSCTVDYYDSMSKGTVRRVMGIEDGCYILHNGQSPTGTSRYRPTNFRLYSRDAQLQLNRATRNALDKLAEKTVLKSVLYIAVRVPMLNSYEIVAHAINQGSATCENMMAETNYEKLQDRIRTRIRAYSDETWLIASGTTLAEMSVPPITFRSA